MYKVLIIDDQPRYLVALINRLKQERYNVEVCESGQDAVELLKSAYKPDIILLDLNLPDGWGTLWIPDIRKHSHSPIVIISKESDKGTMTEAINAGGFVYLEKYLDSELDASDGFKIDPSFAAAQIRQILINHSTQKPIFTFNATKQEAYLNTKNLKLSESDYIILKFLNDNAGIPQLRANILNQFKHLVGGNWKEETDYNLNIVSQHINTIRNKILEVETGFRPIATLQPQQYQLME